MTRDAKLRALSLFDDYLGLSEPARARMRADLQQHDPELLAALLSLLAADGKASLLDIAPAQLLAQARSAEPTPAQADDPRIGTRLGAWQIDGVIAEGGMGTVYAAHRADGQYEQRAALKCVRATLASPALLQAFVGERNHLARLEHPGISTLLDGGVDDAGHPWFAMRYVDGVAVDAWCDRRNASVSERVDLLIQVCEALSYAHAQGIVHRDIKPSNVLVGADGRAHLVDFGISSHFGGGQAPSEHVAITPDYAAPEAREHGIHAPAADQYALGVLMYRLLCAQWPLPLHGLRSLMPIAPAGEPAPMERLLDDAAQSIAHQRGARDIAALRRQLAGDLSAIALKAVALLPQDRYASIGEFAQDLRRWREHRPLGIRPGSSWSRLRKWRRRNPAAALLGATLSVVVLAGLSLSLWQHHRAAKESAATDAVSRLFASVLGTATLSGVGSTPFSSRALLAKTERELTRLPLDDQPALRARSLATLARSYATIGDYRHAQALAAQAQSALGEEADPDGFVAATHVSILNNRARYAEAEQMARAQIDALQGNNDAAATASRLTFLAELARAQWGLGQTPQALASADDLVAQAAPLGPDYAELYAQALILRADFLYRLERQAPAEVDARRAIAVARPLNPILADDALEKLVRIVQSRAKPEARALANELLQRRRRTLGPSHPKTAFALIRASVFHNSGLSKHDLAAALASIRDAYGSDNPQYATAVSSAAWAIARDRQETLAHLRAAIRVLDRNLPGNSEARLSARYNLALVLLFTADGPVTSDTFAEGPVAENELREGLTVLRQTISAKRRAGLPTVPESGLLADYLTDRGDNADLPELETLLHRWRAEVVARSGPADHELRHVDFLHSKLLFRQGRDEQADRGFARFLDAEREFVASGGIEAKPSINLENRSNRLTWALAYRGFRALGTCHRAQAVEFLEQAVKFSATAQRIAPESNPIAQAYLSGMRKAQVPDIAPQILPEADRQRINYAARQCAKPPARAMEHPPRSADP